LRVFSGARQESTLLSSLFELILFSFNWGTVLSKEGFCMSEIVEYDSEKEAKLSEVLINSLPLSGVLKLDLFDKLENKSGFLSRMLSAEMSFSDFLTHGSRRDYYRPPQQYNKETGKYFGVGLWYHHLEKNPDDYMAVKFSDDDMWVAFSKGPNKDHINMIQRRFPHAFTISGNKRLRLTATGLRNTKIGIPVASFEVEPLRKEALVRLEINESQGLVAMCEEVKLSGLYLRSDNEVVEKINSGNRFFDEWGSNSACSAEGMFALADLFVDGTFNPDALKFFRVALRNSLIRSQGMSSLSEFSSVMTINDQELKEFLGNLDDFEVSDNLELLLPADDGGFAEFDFSDFAVDFTSTEDLEYVPKSFTETNETLYYVASKFFRGVFIAELKRELDKKGESYEETLHASLHNERIMRLFAAIWHDRPELIR